jgi:hypothetical protein
MNCTTHPVTPLRYVSSTESVELFPAWIEAAFNRIEEISKRAKPNDGPSPDNIAWAKRVLLRVLPRQYLSGVEIDAFEREIHVNWHHGNKRVTVFLPSPDRLKIYFEEVKGDKVDHDLYKHADDPWAISGVLKWMFS